MSLQSQYVIGLYRDVNPAKNRCRPNMACPLGYLNIVVTPMSRYVQLLRLRHETKTDY